MNLPVTVIITGGRDFDNYAVFKETLDHLFGALAVRLIAGACDRGTLTFTRPDGTKIYGADGLTERYAAEGSYDFTPYPADWKKHGRSAGPIRNSEMIKSGAEICIGFWDGKSKGTFDMMNKADKAGITVIEKRY
jgi:hypothetical protein